MAITLCLGQPADIYLIDEPSAYLDSEQRIMASKVTPNWRTRVCACVRTCSCVCVCACVCDCICV